MRFMIVRTKCRSCRKSHLAIIVGAGCIIEIMPKEPVVLKVVNLTKHFPVRRGLLSKPKEWVQAVDCVSFELKKGQTVGLVGESGCGKTTTGKMIIRLIEPTRGEIELYGQNILNLKQNEFRRHRTKIQFIFQDPYTSLNPRMRVGEIVGEPLKVHAMANGLAKQHRVADILKKVGLKAKHINRFPHEFSGGQRQRIGIARALISDPEIIIADEPVSALDVSIRAQIINLLEDLQEEFGLSYLFISHDLSVVRYVSDVVVVMYLGKIVENGPRFHLYSKPRHPYTQALLSAVPIPDPDFKRSRIYLSGDVPSPISPPTGCSFHTRCEKAKNICRTEEPALTEIKEEHFVACHFI